MNGKILHSPVLFMVFNRPDTTKRVFDAIREAKPSRLFISADGPRESRPEDAKLCQETRDIANNIDWACEVHINYHDKNHGCKVAISSAIDWFFESVDEGIILEDDCLPSQSFFLFCQEVLAKYRDYNQVMQINGNFYLHGLTDITDSYYFSKLSGCWGWATWKRAWNHFDPTMKGYENQKSNVSKYYKNSEISNWMTSYLDEANLPTCGIWSTQWAYAIIRNNGLCVTPTVNLVNNIGFENNPTSGIHKDFLLYNKFPLENIDEIIHPCEIMCNYQNDLLQFETVIKMSDPRLVYSGYKYYWYRLNLRILSLIKKLMRQPSLLWSRLLQWGN